MHTMGTHSMEEGITTEETPLTQCSNSDGRDMGATTGNSNCSNLTKQGSAKFKSAVVAVQISNRMMEIIRVGHRRKWNASSYLSFMTDSDLSKEKLHDFFPNDTIQKTNETQSITEWLFDVMLGQRVSWLLMALPFAWLSHHLQWNPILIFWLNFIAMIPLATFLGDFTEELAAHTNQTIGGLINATFGNAVELVVGIQALLANEIRVVQASMLGSIFSNLLLVLGSCFLFGGLTYKEQSFNSVAATAYTSLIALSSIALILPTPFAHYYEMDNEQVLAISRIAAILLLFIYVQLLIFQLKTHSALFEEDNTESGAVPFSVALTGLSILTLTITFLSDWLVASIDGFVEETGISKTFVGIILLPIVGNAVEHITAVTMAMKNKMDLAMAIAIGSCTQIALFVLPLIVILGWATGIDMTLNFPHFEIILFVMSILIVVISLGNTKSNWLLGSLLVITYVMLALGFWFENLTDYA